MEPEDGLVRRARDGDRAAFEELVRRTSRLIYARLYLETGDPQQAEDLVQETFMRAFRTVKGIQEPSAFRGWLLTIAQSVLTDSFRRAGRRRRAAPPRQSPSVLEQVASAEESGRDERREQVRAVLQSLPEEYRLPLMLRYIDGADYDTITMQLGLSPGQLRGLLHRGLQLLRRTVKPEVPHESA